MHFFIKNAINTPLLLLPSVDSVPFAASVGRPFHKLCRLFRDIRIHNRLLTFDFFLLHTATGNLVFRAFGENLNFF